MTLTADEALKVFEEWQNANTEKLIYVSEFNLFPQTDAGQFCLSVGFYFAGWSDSHTDIKTFYFYGSIIECVEQALIYIEHKKDEYRKKI